MLVNSHPEGNGRYNHLNLIFHPLVLDTLSLFDGQGRVVKSAFDSVICAQNSTQFFALFFGDAVDYTTFVFEPGLELLGNVQVYVFQLFFVSNLVAQVWSIEAALEKLMVLLYAQTLDDVFLNANGCSGSQT